MSFSYRSGDSEVKGDFSKLEKLTEGLSGKHYVDIGILGSSNETVEGGATTAGIGAVHEFGNDENPERSWLRMPLETGQGEIEKALATKLKVLLEKGDIEEILRLIGIAGEARIQEAFETGGFGEWPDIKEETKKRKGSDAILIDDGTLRKSVTSEVGP